MPRLPRSILVVNVNLRDETAEVARSLLRWWMLPATTAGEMEAFIEQTGAATAAQAPTEDTSSGNI